MALIEMKFPEMRHELLSNLRGLADLNYQQDCWVNNICPESVEYDCFDIAIYILFDFTDLDIDADSWIGLILKDKTEAELIQEVCKQINLIFDKYGTTLSDEEYINLPEWSEVLKKSKIALDYFEPKKELK